MDYRRDEGCQSSHESSSSLSLVVDSTCLHPHASTDQHSQGFPWNVTRTESRRRQEAGRLIYNIWTGESGDAGLAEPYLDGRLDLLGLYQTFIFDQDDESGSKENSQDSPRQIDRVHFDDMTYEEFEMTYMRRNRPVVIQGMADDWNASKEWVCRSGDEAQGEPNLTCLADQFGEESVYVFEQTRAGFTASRPTRRKMTIAEYADWWEEHRTAKADAADDDTPLLYMKDWAFLASHPTCNAYQCPQYFSDDWLNDATNHAYAFCYVGPKGTSTVLHADVLLSFSWSTNVCGRKKWYLVPPELTYLLYDCFGTSLATHLHSDLQDGVSSRFPGLHIVRKYAYMLLQEAGETIFVPSKWFHTVQNLDACLSINHNWLNGANISCSWENLEKEILALKTSGEELSDCSPLAADLKLLRSVVAKAVASGRLESHDMGTALAILDASSRYVYI